MNKTTEALKLAEEALNAMLTHMGMDEDEWTKPTFNQAREALAAIREALAEQEEKQLFLDQATYGTSVSVGGKRIDPADFYAEPVKQEPVAYFLDVKAGCSSKPSYEQVPDEYKNDADVFPLYAAPVDAKAIRAEALEEAAKVCRTAQAKGLQSIREAIEAAIRRLK